MKDDAVVILESNLPKKGNRKTSNGRPKENIEKVYDVRPAEVLDKELLRILIEVRNGNFDVRMPIDQVGISGKICDTLNEIIFMNQKMTQEFTRASNTIGKQGKLTHRIEVPFAKGSWSTGVDSLNTLISDLVHPTIEIAGVISSVAKGNLSQQMPLQIGDHVLQGEFARIAKEVNDMVKQLNLFSMEVTRVALEVGTEGKLGGQATVKGVGGVWKDLTDSVNQMASNLTAQVRNIAEVTTSVAKGDLSRKITVDVKGPFGGPGRAHRRGASLRGPGQASDAWVHLRGRHHGILRPGGPDLSSVGVYGVMSYLVSQQTHDIGVRVALGASRPRVLGMVFSRGMMTVVGGLAVGLIAAYAMARLLALLIFGVPASDAITFVGIPLILVAAAALAIYIPAHRATSIDPMIALRYE